MPQCVTQGQVVLDSDLRRRAAGQVTLGLADPRLGLGLSAARDDDERDKTAEQTHDEDTAVPGHRGLMLRESCEGSVSPLRRHSRTLAQLPRRCRRSQRVRPLLNGSDRSVPREDCSGRSGAADP